MQSWKQLSNILFLSAALGCGQSKTPEPKKDTPKIDPKPVVTSQPKPVAPIEEPKPVSTLASTPASASAPTSIPLAAPTGYPAYPYDGLPGWMALASVEKFDGAGSYWSPISTSYQASIFTYDDLWKPTAAGTKFVAIGKTSGGEIEFSKLGEEPYGCDKIPTKMATFTGGKLPEGVVWLLPKGTQGFAPVEIKVGSLTDIPEAFTADAKKAKAIKVVIVGDVKILYYTTAKHKGKMVVFIGNEKTLEEPLEQFEMAGADLEPMAFKSDSEIGVPYPITAYRFGEKWPMGIVLNNSGYEGVGFQILRVTATEAKILDGISAYYCAF